MLEPRGGGTYWHGDRVADGSGGKDDHISFFSFYGNEQILYRPRKNDAMCRQGGWRSVTQLCDWILVYLMLSKAGEVEESTTCPRIDESTLTACVSQGWLACGPVECSWTCSKACCQYCSLLATTFYHDDLIEASLDLCCLFLSLPKWPIHLTSDNS